MPIRLNLSRQRFLLAAALSVVGFGFSQSSEAQQPPPNTRYTLVDLGYLPGQNGSAAFALNDSGSVVGASGTHAVRWDGNGTMLDFGEVQTWANILGINNSGNMVGNATVDDPNDHQFYLYQSIRFNSNGSTTALTSLARQFSSANAINNSNLVVGTALGTAVRFDFNGFGTTPIAPSTFGSVAYAVNDNGLAAGYYGNNAALFDAVSGNPNVTFLPSCPDEELSRAYGLNVLGEAVGESKIASLSQSTGSFRAARWRSGASAGEPIGPIFSSAYGIDGAGTVVGQVFFNRGVRWDSTNQLVDLNDVLDSSGTGWQVTEIRAINRNGQLAGTALHNGRYTAVLLTPNPNAPLPSVRVSITLSTDHTTPGSDVTGTVKLSSPAPSGGAVVTLTTDQSAEVQPPVSVTVPAGQTQTSFTVHTLPSSDFWMAIVQAHYGQSQVSSYLALLPMPVTNWLYDMTLTPMTVTGGQASTGRVYMQGQVQTTPTTVALFSSDTSLATVAPSVTVPAGSTTAKFRVITHRVKTQTHVTITAYYNGTLVETNLTLKPGPNPIRFTPIGR